MNELYFNTIKAESLVVGHLYDFNISQEVLVSAPISFYQMTRGNRPTKQGGKHGKERMWDEIYVPKYLIGSKQRWRWVELKSVCVPLTLSRAPAAPRSVNNFQQL